MVMLLSALYSCLDVCVPLHHVPARISERIPDTCRVAPSRLQLYSHGKNFKTYKNFGIKIDRKHIERSQWWLFFHDYLCHSTNKTNLLHAKYEASFIVPTLWFHASQSKVFTIPFSYALS